MREFHDIAYNATKEPYVKYCTIGKQNMEKIAKVHIHDIPLNL